MIQYEFDLNLGFILPVGKLHAVLHAISNEEQSWTAVPVPSLIFRDTGDPRGYIAIGFSNAEPSGKPNYLAYLFPLVSFGSPPSYGRSKDDLLVCIHPEAATSLVRGLYPEDEKMKYDLMEDWERFWVPLRDAIVSYRQEAGSGGSLYLQEEEPSR